MLTHPLLDHVAVVDGTFFACTETRADVVFLSEGLTGFLIEITQAGHVPVLITSAQARVTFAATYACELAGVIWVLRTEYGFVDTRTGIALSRLEELTRVPHDQAADHTADHTAEALPQLTAPDRSHTQVLFGVTVQHRATLDTRLGDALRIMCETLTGVPPVAWGMHEPALASWNQNSYTHTARSLMPAESRYVFSGAGRVPFQALSLVRRTSKGVEETLTGGVVLGTNEAGVMPSLQNLPQVLAQVADALTMPVIGSLMVRVGSGDLTQSSAPAAAAFPIAALIGPRAVRDLGLGGTTPASLEFQERFGAVVAGRKRLPSLILPFTDADTGSWQQMHDALEALDPAKLRQAFGLPESNTNGSGLTGPGLGVF